MALRERISSPLEAGPSLLDAHHIAPHLLPVLEYTSGRLARKSIHLTLIIVKRDYQLLNSPISSSSSSSSSSPPFSPQQQQQQQQQQHLKHLMRSASQHVVGSSPRSAAGPPSSTYPSTEPASSPRFWWPLSPAFPSSPPPMTPSTTTTTSSLTTTESNGSTASNNSSSTGSLRCFHSGDLSPRTDKILKSTLIKAGNKFGVGSGWLVPLTSPSTRDLTTQLYHSSVVQNEVLFSSDGLSLLTLDRLYSIKSALSSYSKSNSPLRLEDAVDELRRYVLANNGGKVTRADLLRSYDWLGVSASAIGDLDRMYRRAYGGPELVGGITGMPSSSSSSLSPSSTILDDGIVNVAMTAVKFSRPPTPRRIGPPLKLQTDFSPKSRSPVEPDKKPPEVPKIEEPEEEAHTARPVDRSVASMWNTRFTIDQMLSPSTNTDLQPHSPAIGPMTPHGYDDISPVTRGEWGFLMGGNGLNIGKTAAVETF
ncbi:uncharacterized protein TRIREDRAFT_67024 [Trichoderma reesei QM6a]|uniref:Predicted protein n=2 Tax=Hypocrea jecorina TaxID=51453 RepID=G0RS07_HYPJQ|nr:uncharacterized protein TRIREDRAFT_67024 [Trichoderma reesei QM6a]EGR46072.1 predicted protein [Trichoderma reesei QM6a]ETR99120.1 hypothetical protein M419DRAFT_86949 [Trichoderma reesei RUT C-30]